MKNPDTLHIHDSARQSARGETSTTRADIVSAGSTAHTTADATMRCPACRAQQVWSPECRRCGADLMLLGQFASTCLHQRRQSLIALREGRNHMATRHASRLYQLRPDADSARLLAVCLLMSGNFAPASRIARMHEA